MERDSDREIDIDMDMNSNIYCDSDGARVSFFLVVVI